MLPLFCNVIFLRFLAFIAHSVPHTTHLITNQNNISCAHASSQHLNTNKETKPSGTLFLIEERETSHFCAIFFGEFSVWILLIKGLGAVDFAIQFEDKRKIIAYIIGTNYLLSNIIV